MTQHRLLVVTSDERTWSVDRPMLFLGEWCRRYDRRHVWQRRDIELAVPYGMSSEERHRDAAYVQSLAADLLKDLGDALNAHHSVDLSNRQWNIVLGHWLQRYCAVLFNRYATVQQVLQNYDVKCAFSVSGVGASLASTSSLEFVHRASEPAWNQLIYERLLSEFGCTLQHVGSSSDQSAAAEVEVRSSGRQPRRLPIWRWAAKLARSTDAFVVASYLPRVLEAQLQLKMRQFPQRWTSPSVDYTSTDAALRGRLQLRSDHVSGFERFARQQIFDAIPNCFLESFHIIGEQLEKLDWPKAPKFIFTSNSFDFDEVFKRWAANKSAEGVPYLVGQHGNNYGTHYYHGNAKWPDQASSDAFLTWGWSRRSTDVATFLFKTADKRRRAGPVGNRLALLQLQLPLQIDTFDVTKEHSEYYREQLRFVSALPAAVAKDAVVRLAPGVHMSPWCDVQRWNDSGLQVTVEPGHLPLRSILADARLVVHSYDSTGIMETFAQNIPTVCFWRGELDHLMPDAKPYYEALAAVGVIHWTADSAAQHVARVWNNVWAWWTSPNTVAAVAAFSARYGRAADKPVDMLAAALMTEAERVRSGTAGHVR